MVFREMYQGVKRGLYSMAKPFIGTGKLAKNVAKFSLLTASGYGIYAYIKGNQWPFTQIDENVYQPTQWITGNPGPILEGPRTAWYLRPFYKKIADSEGNPITISKRIGQRDSQLSFGTEDGLQGTFRIQYTYRIPNAQNAFKNFWNPTKDPEKVLAMVDEDVKGALTSEMGRLELEDIFGDTPTLENQFENARRRLNGERLPINQGTGRRRISSPLQKYGVEIETIVRSDPTFSQSSQSALLKTFDAEQTAAADQTRAKSTANQYSIYARVADRLIEGGGYSADQRGQLIMDMIKMDNDEAMSKNAPMVLSKAFGGSQESVQRTANLESKIGTIEQGIGAMAQGIEKVTEGLAGKIGSIEQGIGELAKGFSDKIADLYARIDASGSEPEPQTA